MITRSISMLAFSLVVVVGLTGVSNCQNKVVSGVATSVNPANNSLRAQLNFDPKIQIDFGGAFAIDVNGTSFGEVFVKPSLPDEPFNIGFDLNIDILNAQNLVGFEPVTTLPSGQPLPTMIGRPMLAIHVHHSLTSKFDVHLLLDSAIEKREWVGVVITLNFLNQVFPAGMSVSENFLKDAAGMPRMSAGVYGGKADASGNLLAPGGIGYFVNVRSLIDQPPVSATEVLK